MYSASFDSTKISLHDLLKEIGVGKIQLPDFQRGWVWDDEHIISLIESIAESFPIGAVMMLATGKAASFSARLVEGENPLLLIQRRSSLMDNSVSRLSIKLS